MGTSWGVSVCFGSVGSRLGAVLQGFRRTGDATYQTKCNVNEKRHFKLLLKWITFIIGLESQTQTAPLRAFGLRTLSIWMHTLRAHGLDGLVTSYPPRLLFENFTKRPFARMGHLSVSFGSVSYQIDGISIWTLFD